MKRLASLAWELVSPGTFPASNYSAQQIVADACAIAKAPGMTAFGGRALNMVLDDLVIHRDLKINRVTQSIVVQANSNGPFALENDYLRTYDLFYMIPSTSSVAGIPILLFPVGTETYDREYKDPSLANYPYEYMTDLSGNADNPPTAGQLYIYPQSNGQLTLTHRYMVRRASISSPETNANPPWFPDQDYLVHAVAARVMKLTDDARYDSFVKQAEDMLRIHLIMEGDEQKVAKVVRLDPRAFRTIKKLRPTKSIGW